MKWLVALVLLAGCGGPPPCVSSASCGAGQVCRLDGRCGPLDAPSGARFAGSRWVPASDWGIASSSASRADDVLSVGGPDRAQALLAFGPLPTERGVLRALLVLTPHEPPAGIARTGELVVEHVEPFRGGLLPPRDGLPLRFAAARVALPAGPARPVRVDLTAAVRAAAARRDRTLYIAVRLVDGDPAGARFASPWATGARGQPRLELLLH